MNKYIVTGDLHIQEKNLVEIQEILLQIKNIVNSSEYEGIIILGDVYNHSIPTNSEIETFVTFLSNINKTKKIYLISGNHDIYKEHNALSWIPIVFKNITYHKHCINIRINSKSVMMLHTDVAESKLGPDDIQLGKTPVADYKVDILLLGHIHKSQILKESNPVSLHPGSPYYINFGECNDKKGVYSLDISQKIKINFIPLQVVPMKQLEASNSDLNKILNIIETLSDNLKLNLI